VLDLDTYERFGRTGDEHKRARIEQLRAKGYLSERRAGVAPGDDADTGPRMRPPPEPQHHRGNGHGDYHVDDGRRVNPPWPAFDHDALHGLAGDFVMAVEPHTEADPVALLVQFLVAFGNAAGRSPHFRVEGDEHHTNLDAVMVGRTSKGRKGTSWGRVRQFYAQADSAWTKGREVSGLCSGEGLIWAVRDPVYEVDEDGDQKMSDPGVSDKRLMVLEAEFASSLRVSKRETNILCAVIRTAWDTGTLRTLAKNSPAVATDAHISIIGHITKDELLRHLDATEMANGFANRFLWVCVQRSKCLPEGGNLSESTLISLSSCIRKTLEAAGRVGQMRRSEAARGLWGEVYEKLSDGEPGLFGAITSRAEAQVTRLSCIYALLDGSSVIEAPHLKAALALWDYCEQSCRYIFGDALGNPIADRILQALRGSPNGLNRSQISHLLGRNEAASAIENALRVLVEYQLAVREVFRTGGRPEERWCAITKKTKETKKAQRNGASDESGARATTGSAI